MHQGQRKICFHPLHTNANIHTSEACPIVDWWVLHCFLVRLFFGCCKLRIPRIKMELENIVANTVYIKAKESMSLSIWLFTLGGTNKDKGRSKKWRDILAFPHVSIARRTLRTLGSLRFFFPDVVDVSYNYVVLQQPIGKKLFWCYCHSKPALKNLIEFLDLAVIRILGWLWFRTFMKLILRNQVTKLLLR